MYYNQQYKENNLNQQFLGQQDIPIPVNQPNYYSGNNVNNNINNPYSNPQQINSQMNFPQQINSQMNFPQQINPQMNFPQQNPQMNIPQQLNSNSAYFPPNYFQYYPQNFIKPEN